MKRFWKIFGITLGSLLGVILIVLCIAFYVVFTPDRLTPIVRNVAAEFITTEHAIDEVELTFFSTFPEFGLHAKGLYVVNPMEGAPSDTLIAAPDVVATVNVRKFLKENTLEIRELTLQDAVANIFINAAGEGNYDVFAASSDTTTADTTAFTLPFERIQVENLQLTASQITFISSQDSINAALQNTSITASVNNWDDISLTAAIPALSFTMGEEQYADNLHLNLNLPHTEVDLSTMRFVLHQATLGVNAFALAVDGEVTLQDDIAVDATLTANNWEIVPLLQLVPASFLTALDGIDIDGGILSLSAKATGVYNDSTMPVIDAHLTLDNAKGQYKEVFPYYLKDIDLQAEAHLNLNDSLASTATIHKLHASTGTTSIDATGEVTELLSDMLCNVQANVCLHLPDVEYYLNDTKPYANTTKGEAKGTVQARIRLSDLTAMRLEKGHIAADLHLTDVDVVYDSMLIRSPKLDLALQIPNPTPTANKTDWVDATLTTTGLTFEMPQTLQTALGASTVRIETSDVLSNNPLLYAKVALQTKSLKADMDSLNATFAQPSVTAYVEYNMQDSTQIPVADVSLQFADLQGSYTDIVAHLAQSSLTANLSGTRKDKSQPRLKSSLETQAIQAKMGTDVDVQTKHLSLTAQATYSPKQENLLLQWRPRLSVDLTDGVAQLASFPETVYIPQIKFDYSNKEFAISDSRILLGNSDFALSGDVRNIGKWIRKKGNLEGELNFVSEHTDVNELLTLFSADSGSEEESPAQTKEASTEPAVAANTTDEANPFLVPKDVDLTLNTHIQEAVVFDQLARDLGGKLYVQNGILVLEEMGFICNAARLQLTAMYKTPRRNHIYCGLDYHMTNINIQELVNMIPQIDTMMPMLRSFRGAGEFHLAAETFLNAKYEMKMSTARGACSISGKDLVLLDGETFSQIAKILMFNKKTENKIDSISAEITLFKNEIDIYPFCLTMDKYMAAVGGRHNLDMSFDYHIDLLSPLYIGVDVRGTFDDLKIRPATCKYAKDFRPIFRREVETQTAELRQHIRESLKKNLKK